MILSLFRVKIREVAFEYIHMCVALFKCLHDAKCKHLSHRKNFKQLAFSFDLDLKFLSATKFKDI